MTWTNLPPLNSLIPFEATVRLGSLTAAARELHVTHGAVSRQLQILERAVGATLFTRAGRTLVPTGSAVELSKHVSDALTLLAAAARQVKPHPDRDVLVLSCEPTLMMRWLLPRLPSLDSIEDTVNLHLSAGGGEVDLQRAGVDVAIRRNDFPIPESFAVRPLFEEWVGPVCSPETRERMQHVDRLGATPRLLSASRPSVWETWAQATGELIEDAPVRVFEHFYLSLEAAMAGLGVAIGPYAAVERDLIAGRLVAPFGFVKDGSKYVLLAPKIGADPRIAAIHAWLMAQAPESVPPERLRRGFSITESGS